MNGLAAVVVLFFFGLYTIIFLMPILRSGGAWIPFFSVLLGVLAIDSLMGGKIAGWLGIGGIAIDYIYFMDSMAVVSGLVFTVKLEGAAFAAMGVLYFFYFTLAAGRLALRAFALKVDDWRKDWPSFRQWVKACDIYLLLFVVGALLFL